MAGDDKEQQLREKIASQKAAIAALPSLSSIVRVTGPKSSETKARAQLINELLDNEEQLELLIESKRVAAVVHLQDELYPPESEDCPICLETIKHVHSKTCVRFYCCGGLSCTKCGEERMTKLVIEGHDKMFHGKCPLCREKIPCDIKEIRAMVLQQANKGKAWAQANIGQWYLHGKFGFAVNKKKGLQFLKRAADQRDPNGLYWMGLVYKDRSMTNTNFIHYLKEAADAGQRDAQRMFGLAHSSRDDKIHLHYITLAASQGDPDAWGMLGNLFLNARCGLTRSLILTKHYTETHVTDTDNLFPLYVYNYSNVLFELAAERYENILEIPGHSPIPKILYWASRAQKVNSPVGVYDHQIKHMSSIENKTKNHCANCWKEAGCSSFMRCSRCLGAWYCGKECQAQHWKAGHKIDCIKTK